MARMETIKGRKSVRTFDGNMLTDQHRKDAQSAKMAFLGKERKPQGCLTE